MEWSEIEQLIKDHARFFEGHRRWQCYETFKKSLARFDLSSKEYERAIGEYCWAVGL